MDQGTVIKKGRGTDLILMIVYFYMSDFTVNQAKSVTCT